MEGSKAGGTPEPATRVCPRCGREAGEHEYCQMCGLHLTEQPELPTRRQWEDGQAQDRTQGARAPSRVLQRPWPSARSSTRIGVLAAAALAFLGIVLVLALEVLEGDSGPGPEETVQEYFDAASAGDGARACDQLTRDQERLTGEDVSDFLDARTDCAAGLTAIGQALNASERGNLRDVEVVETEVRDDRATVRTGDGAEIELDLVDGKWLIADIPAVLGG